VLQRYKFCTKHIYIYMHLRLQTEKYTRRYKTSNSFLTIFCLNTMQVAYLQMSHSKPMISLMDLRSYFDPYLRPFLPNMVWEHPHDTHLHTTFSVLRLPPQQNSLSLVSDPCTKVDHNYFSIIHHSNALFPLLSLFLVTTS
jgi:hypothetical protein